MELLLILAWLCFLIYIARARNGTLQAHLLIIWLIMFGAGLWQLGRLALSYFAA